MSHLERPVIARIRLPYPHLSKSARPGPSGRPKGPTPPDQQSLWRRWMWPLLLVVLVGLVLWWAASPGNGGGSLAYSTFVDRVEGDRVKSVSINDDGFLHGTMKDGDDFTTQIPSALDTDALAGRLRAHDVKVTGTRTGTSGSNIVVSLILLFLPLLLLLGFFAWAGRQASRTLGGGISGIGRSRAKIIEAERPTTRFSDVAGYEGVKQEVSEIVDFLKRPDRYAAAGAKGPRGVIMIGPPGAGKTLLARAVAGEAHVPFLSVTGSAFVEMFVGVGASRVRDLFEEAAKRAPSIIFIDEIDAVGSRRSGPRVGGNDEREQTLNQLLAEMDGFDPRSGIVVLAATNRPDALDPALLRPGRFDRRVTVPLPNANERAAILAVHARGKNISPEVNWEAVARATPGFSGADLANLVNEAAINAVRADRSTIEPRDLDTARDRVLLGRRESSNALLPEERRSVAVHESGHALVAALSEHADPVAKVTILPSGPALGITEQLPEAERHLFSESYLNDLLAVRLGGRAAELVVFGEGSTGAADDLAGATQIATRMVREFGLSTELGPVGYSSGAQQFLGGGGESVEEQLRRPYSEQTQRVVDEEVTRLIQQAERRAVGLLQDHRQALDRLAELLVARETVDGSMVREILEQNGGGAAGAVSTEQ
ncbi:ATP-dependent zinc metalloprotease FtsH [Streptomyces hoynatensis]|uniref:ATP-dependent zinc metalloprotease FtsH n=1 Tax=Streptomyces hoynatensis TaxID=1141874 RepID=A0A3A9Z133_9ACTN|nr:ATP-dependent zinc metalloprotease FtsH [Streptomyces hoynatensis]RKN41739.1 ATP-dependent metallopeptidase FtsH/Yme1/Tma family protein [Streptomyces hoynatensis]